VKKVLVTGGAGFIASHIVDGYLKEGWEVVVIDNLSTGKRENLNKKVRFYQMDIRDKRLDDVFSREGFNLVNHHAAQMNVRISVEKPLFDAEVNILGTLNLLDSCIKHGVDGFIFASSGGAIYGEPEHLPVDERSPKRALSPYGISKHVVEHYLYCYRENFGLNYICLRYGNVYGPRQDPYGEAGVISIFTHQILQGQRPRIFGDGEQIRDYIYVGDVVDVNMLVSQKVEELNGKQISSMDSLAYNIGTGKGISVNYLYKLLAEVLDFKESPIYAPARKGEIRRIYLDTARVKSELNWQAKIDLGEGLEALIKWISFTKQV